MSLEVTSKFNIPVITPIHTHITHTGAQFINFFLPLYCTVVFFDMWEFS